MEIWKQRSRNHDVIHTQYQRSNRRENTNQDPSCGICNNDFPEGGRQKFNMFWEWYRKITDEFSEETENEKVRCNKRRGGGPVTDRQV